MAPTTTTRTLDPTTTSRHFELHRNILADLGHELRRGASVLDFGCSAGGMVRHYRQAGFAAFGCDIKLDDETDLLRRMDAETYRIPFNDASFDFVFSDQVLEHVRDHAHAFAEIERVMKPSALSLHIFPAKLKPTEGHVFVPLGGVIQNRPWLTLWALMGIMNSFQRGKGFREVVELNTRFLKHQTNYLSKSELIRAVATAFDNLVFAEEFMIKHSYGGARRLYPFAKRLPFIAALYSSFYCRVIFFQKPAARWISDVGTPH